MLILFSFFGTICNVSAKTAIAIGTNYGSAGGDSSGEAETAATYAAKMGYSSYLTTQPTYEKISNYITTFKNGGTNGILFFHGHANSSEMTWNYNNKGGDYKVGLHRSKSYCAIDGYTYTSIDSFKLSNAKLVIFMGCNTAKDTSNFPSTAVNKGAKAAIGWKETVVEGDTDVWIYRFYTKLSSGGTINESINYANGFSDYKKNSNIKSTKKYGSTTASLNFTVEELETMSEIITSQNVKNKIDTVTKKTYALSKKEIVEVSDIINYIKNSYNSSFDINNYQYEMTETDSESIYDFNLIIDGAKSNIGYTVFVTNDEITVVDNMNNYSEGKSAINVCSLENFDEDELKNIALSRHQNHADEYEISIESTSKSYDVENGKKYFDVFIKYYNATHDVTSIVVESFEI